MFGVAFLYSGSLWSSLYCEVSSLCVGLYRWLVKVSWLGKLVGVLVGGAGFFSLWSAMKCPVMSYEMSMVFVVTLGSLYIGAQGCVPGEFVWYVLFWNLLALGWCLVSV